MIENTVIQQTDAENLAGGFQAFGDFHIRLTRFQLNSNAKSDRDGFSWHFPLDPGPRHRLVR
jgi:hypothetical protein